MIDNMVFYSEKARQLEEGLTETLIENARKFKPSQFIKVLELFGKVSDNRMKSQKCAIAAAPYLHERLGRV